MITARESAQYLGRTGQVQITGQRGITFTVKVSDVRMVYNAIQLLCEPVSGTGSKWYALDSITLDNVKPQEVK